MQINATFEGTSGQNANFVSAVDTAVNYYDQEFTNNVTVNIDFNFASVSGSSVAQTSNTVDSFSYAALETALYNQDTAAGASSAQQTAAATLPTTDPSNGFGTWYATQAYARMLGLSVPMSSATSPDASITLNSNLSYFYNQASSMAGAYDAVGALEHEISESIGRVADGGKGSTPEYTMLDLFRYTAAGGGFSSTIEPPGTPVEQRAEPFALGAGQQSYFSPDGKTVTLPYDNPNDVAAGADVGDWDPSVTGDSYGAGMPGVVGAISPTDLEEMNVLGYDLVCFATGTLIRTTRGEIEVEALRVDDLAVTASGAHRPVRWIGHRTIDCRKHPRPHEVYPVRVSAHAFGADLPERNLCLSPGHPVLVGGDDDGHGGHLVPIMCLINGTTIERVAVATVTYWHIELDAHDILLAEGLPAESYLDWGDRGFFTEGACHALANPDFVVPGLAGRCRPVAVDGPVVEAERRRLDALFVARLHAECAWPCAGDVALREV